MRDIEINGNVGDVIGTWIKFDDVRVFLQQAERDARHIPHEHPNEDDSQAHVQEDVADALRGHAHRFQNADGGGLF